MAGPRTLVDPPTFSDRNYGLLSVVQARYDVADQHWRNGVTWDDLCGVGLTTYSPYCVSGSVPASMHRGSRCGAIRTPTPPFITQPPHPAQASPTC